MLHTDYGVRLLLKLALVAAILGIAALNKFVLTPALQSDKPGAAQSIVRSIRLEALLMALVIAVAATLTMVRPPRALVEKASASAQTRPITSAGFRSTWTQGAYAVEIEVTPAQPGANMIMLRFTHATGAPAAMKSASIDLALPTANIEGISREGQSVAPDRFHLMVSDMIIPGNWKLTINGFIDDFDKVAIEGTVPIN